MPIAVTCGSCGKQYQAKDTLAGKRIKCQQCGAAVDVPGPAETPAAPEAPAKITVECGSCGKKFQAGANLAGKRIKCPQCSEAISVPAAGEPAKPAARPKQPAAQKPAAAKPAAQPQPAAAASPAAANPLPPAANAIGSILDEEFAAGAMPNVAVAGQKYCVNCKAIIAAHSFFCVYCGFDERTGKAAITQGTQKRVRLPGELPVFGYIVAALAALDGLVKSIVFGILTFVCLMIFLEHGLPDDKNPEGALGFFGLPTSGLLLIASVLLFVSAILIFIRRKGSINNAALASATLVGFNAFAMAICTIVIVMGYNKPKDNTHTPDAPPGTFEWLTNDVYVELWLWTILFCAVPALTWLWWKFQGRLIDHEWPEPEYKSTKKRTGSTPDVSFGNRAVAVARGPSPAVLKKVRGPATFMQIIGWLNVVGNLLYLILGVWLLVAGDSAVEQAPQLEAIQQFGAVFIIIFACIGLGIGFLFVNAGGRMKECDGYGLAIASSILMIVLICLPIGIWSLVVLLNEDVKKAFQTSV